jgi:YggT family protein
MMIPVIELLIEVLRLYSWCIIAWAVTEMLISFKVINAYQPAVQKIRYALNRISEPVLRPIRKILPDLGGIDVSPIILLLLLNFAENELFQMIRYLA